MQLPQTTCGTYTVKNVFICSANPGGNYTASSGSLYTTHHHARPPPSPRRVPFSYCQRPFGLKTTTRESRTHFSFVRVRLAQRYSGGFFLKRQRSFAASDIFFFCSSDIVLDLVSHNFFVVSLNFCLTSSV